MYILKRLVLTGNEKVNASLSFINGVNYIVGPSNKGKSFIYECLRYMLGSSRLPKEIPESIGYTDLYLEIIFDDNSTVTLHRSLVDTNRARIFYSGFGSLNIESSTEIKINAEDGSLSQFYLERINYPLSARIRSNASNEKKRLTYNSIRSFFMISERDIISEESYHFDMMSKSYVLGILKYIITGFDDIALQELDDDKVFKAKKLARIELLRQLLIEYAERRRVIEGKLLDTDYTREEEYKRIILAQIDNINTNLEDHLTKYESINSLLVSTSEQLSSERLAKKRLDLVKFNYLNDIARLSAIAEGVNFVGQLLDEKCPICGTIIHHDSGQPDKTELYIAQSASEADKIRKNLAELEKMIETTERNVQNLTSQYNSLKLQISVISEERSKIDSQRYSSETQLEKIIETSNMRSELLQITNQIDNYTKMILDYDAQKNEMPKYSYDIPTNTIEFMENRLSRILFLWGQGKKEIDFTFNDIDFSADGVRRRSNGKGVRGIFNFALAITIIEMAFSVGRPFSSFLIIDSPFTNFRQDRQALGQDRSEIARTEATILRDLGRNHKAIQIIIMENKEGFGEANVDNINIINLDNSGFIPTGV